MNGTRDFLFRYPRRIHEKRKSNEAGSDESSGFSPLSASHLRLAAANHVPKTEGSPRLPYSSRLPYRHSFRPRSSISPIPSFSGTISLSPRKNTLRRRFPSSARKSPCRPPTAALHRPAGRAGIAFFPAGQYPSLPTHSRISPALARFNSFPSFQSMSGYVFFNAAALFVMPLLPEVANGMTVLPFRS